MEVWNDVQMKTSGVCSYLVLEVVKCFWGCSSNRPARTGSGADETQWRGMEALRNTQIFGICTNPRVVTEC